MSKIGDMLDPIVAGGTKRTASQLIDDLANDVLAQVDRISQEKVVPRHEVKSALSRIKYAVETALRR